ncbi:MAG: hypothetical protein HY803_12295 [candidate division NC10 bacterium]|nr:hypothetical protein [candidate division NC10 bacterium]
MTVALFPFPHYWWFYPGFTAFVLLLLALDLGVLHRNSREVRFREAAAWCAVWVSLALAFNWYGGKFPIAYSLGFIGSVIAASIILSFLFAKRQPAAPPVTGGQEGAP